MENVVWQQPEEPNSPGINKLIRANVDKCVAVVIMQCGGTQATVSHTRLTQLHMKLQLTLFSTWKLISVQFLVALTSPKYYLGVPDRPWAHKKLTFYLTGVQNKLTEEPIQPHIWPRRKRRMSTQRRDGGRRKAARSVRVERDKTQEVGHAAQSEFSWNY